MNINKLNLLHGLQFMMIAAIILQLDAYFYLSGLYDIKPRNIVLLVFLLFGISLAATQGLPSWKNLSARGEVRFLLLCVFIYILVQLIGITSWENLPDELITYWFWVYMLLLVLLGLISGYELKEKRTDFFLLVLIVHAAILLLDSVFGGISETSHFARASGTLRNPNNAAFLAVALMAGCIRWNREHPGIKEVLALVLTIAAVGLTGSRGGALILFILLSFILFWWVSKAEMSWQKIKRVLMGGSIICIVMGITILAIYELRYVKRANLKGDQGVAIVDMVEPNNREEAVAIAFKLIKERPWLGHGTGYIYNQEIGSHNMFLRSLVEVGVLGLLAYLMLPTGLLWVARQRQDWGLAALALCGFFAGLVAHTITENRSFLIIMGIMLWMNSSNRSAVQVAYTKDS